LHLAQQAHSDCLGDLPDPENAILNISKAVDLMDDGHPNKLIHFSSLGIAQQTCFDHLSDSSDLVMNCCK
jgi:hypothetical protein